MSDTETNARPSSLPSGTEAKPLGYVSSIEISQLLRGGSVADLFGARPGESGFEPVYLAPPAIAGVAIPVGWKLVPIKPTAEMETAGQEWMAAGDVYEAMVEVAPSPPASPSGETVEVALDAAVLAYDNARIAAHGGTDKPMSEVNRKSIAPMILAAIQTYNSYAAALASSSASPKGDEDRVLTDASIEAQALERFTGYFVRNYPGPDTIIFDPKWHAPKIFRAVVSALSEASERERSSNPSKCEREGDIEDRKSDDLLRAANNLLPYLNWQLSAESPGFHPTFPSAVAAFENALSALSKREARPSKQWKPGDMKIENGVRYRFIEEELEGEKWEVLGPSKEGDEPDFIWAERIARQLNDLGPGNIDAQIDVLTRAFRKTAPKQGDARNAVIERGAQEAFLTELAEKPLPSEMFGENSVNYKQGYTRIVEKARSLKSPSADRGGQP